jgi:hypothetical protein
MACCTTTVGRSSAEGATMALVYRAVWDDYSCDPVGVLDDEFAAWCSTKGIEPADLPHRGIEVIEGRQLEVRRADAEVGRALRCRLAETDNRGRTWTTTATALSDREVSTFWIDLDLHDPEGRAVEMAAPRLVRALIDKGGEPEAFGRRIQVRARRIGVKTVNDLIDVLKDRERRLPVVVFSPDRKAGPEQTLKRADAAAETLAGIALTYAFSPQVQDRFDQALPEGFRVYGGAVRLYLPDLQLDNPDDALRHRFLPPGTIAVHPRRAASILSTRLARQQFHPPIPEAWDRLRELLLRPSEQEIGDRASALAAERADGTEADAAELNGRIDLLEHRLAEVGLFHEAITRELKGKIADLEGTVSVLEEASWSDADEMEELRRENESLRRNIRLLHAPSAPTEDEFDEPHLLEAPSTIQEAVTLAQTHLDHLVVPPESLVDIENLDSSPKYGAWASATWQALVALHDYAETKTTGERPAGFRIWCQETSCWPASKVAMSESDTVQNNPRLRDQRLFPVSTDVDAQGRIHMFAHLKVQAGGGTLIPRIYFHDDTDGVTRKMHVGFIGPHSQVQNTRT